MKPLIPLGIIVICAGAYYMYIGPMVKEVNGMRLKLQDYKTIEANTVELKNSLEAKVSAFSSIPDEDMAKLDKIIPTKLNNVILVADLNTITARSGMVVKNVKLTEVVSDNPDQVVAESQTKPYKVVSAEFTVSGTYDQFIRFLKDLETSIRLFDVRSVDIKSGQKSDKGQNSTLEYTLKIDSYYLR